MSDKPKVKGIKTGFILILIGLSFLAGAWVESVDLDYVLACITAESLQ